MSDHVHALETARDRPDDAEIVTPCDQCGGTGMMPGGGRCGCREEDDEARERRKRMGIVRRHAQVSP